MMSEICMKSKIILNNLKEGTNQLSPEELKKKLDLMEYEMIEYAKELDCGY